MPRYSLLFLSHAKTKQKGSLQKSNLTIGTSIFQKTKAIGQTPPLPTLRDPDPAVVQFRNIQVTTKLVNTTFSEEWGNHNATAAAWFLLETSWFELVVRFTRASLKILKMFVNP